MAKKAAKKKTSPRKKTATPATEAAPERIPEPKEFVEQAIDFASKADEQFALACHHLNDGAKFFSAMDPEVRRDWIININKFIEQAQFGISSFRDELRVALNLQRGKKDEAIKFAPAAVPESVPAPESAVPVTVEASLKKTLSLLGFALQTMASREFPGAQARYVQETIELLEGIRKKVNQDIDTLASQAPKEAA